MKRHDATIETSRHICDPEAFLIACRHGFPHPRWRDDARRHHGQATARRPRLSHALPFVITTSLGRPEKSAFVVGASAARGWRGISVQNGQHESRPACGVSDQRRRHVFQVHRDGDEAIRDGERRRLGRLVQRAVTTACRCRERVVGRRTCTSAVASGWRWRPGSRGLEGDDNTSRLRIEHRVEGVWRSCARSGLRVRVWRL
jgi:hypothetical protein